MQTDRYPYSPIVERPPLKWPNGARVAVCVVPNIECFHIDKPLNRESPQLPDVQNYSLRDYGARVGVFRMMDVLDRYRDSRQRGPQYRCMRSVSGNYRAREKT